MNVKGIAAKAFTSTAIAVTAVALGSAPASAGTNGSEYTRAQSCGAISCTAIPVGKGTFTANGDKWEACDLSADGDRVIVEARWVSGGATHIYSATAASGEGTCATYSKDIPEGVTVNLKVWHQDGANGTPKDVNGFKGVA
ncbi:hypothetical protein [Streptomyces aurantiogriseus]|uniref:Secreted protein n=1 Tax=Streptomyces aurantiogriseus TaxID=66870 RepID=A0A918BU24_9ACTN|nr:hypothetical protein [Streptomyces aurantiogriseus]GGQ92678.1 hypothetical protein GCM10010251_04180 [Streptomyces aurantiogriseus]